MTRLHTGWQLTGDAVIDLMAGDDNLRIAALNRPWMECGTMISGVIDNGRRSPRTAAERTTISSAATAE